MSKRAVSTWVVIGLLIVVSLWGVRTDMVQNWFFSVWRAAIGDSYTYKSYKSLNIKLPGNWVAFKYGGNLTLLRRQEDTGIISASFHPLAFTREMFDTKPMIVMMGGERFMQQSVEDITIGGYDAILAHAIVDGTYYATFSVPEHKLDGTFTGNRDGYNEFLDIVKSASFLEAAT